MGHKIPQTGVSHLESCFLRVLGGGGLTSPPGCCKNHMLISRLITNFIELLSWGESGWLSQRQLSGPIRKFV